MAKDVTFSKKTGTITGTSGNDIIKAQDYFGYSSSNLKVNA